MLSSLRALESERRKRIVRHLQGLLDELPKQAPADAATALLPPAMEKIIGEGPQLPEPLAKVPSSLAGYKELLRRTQSAKGHASKTTKPTPSEGK